MAPNTDKISVLGAYQQALLIANMGLLGMQAVFYGDQQLIPKSPSVCVETGPMTRDLTHTGLAAENTFTNYFMVYHTKLQDEQMTRLQCEQQAEAIVTLLHTDKQMGGLVIQGWVSGVEPGFAVRSNAMMRVSRITWSGISKTII